MGILFSKRSKEDKSPFDNPGIPVSPSRPYFSLDESLETPRHRTGYVYDDSFVDDEEMIRFVSALSLAELDHTHSNAKPERSRLPDVLEEFFLSLDAEASANAASNLQYELAISQEKEEAIFHGSQIKECSTCIEEKPVKSFPKVTTACEHENQTCLDCIQNWLAQEVDSTGWNKIHCVACSEVIQYHDMKKLATKSVFEK